jgi:hypothetical protein
MAGFGFYTSPQIVSTLSVQLVLQTGLGDSGHAQSLNQ